MNKDNLEEAKVKIRDANTKAKARLKILQKLRKDELNSHSTKIYSDVCRNESERIMSSFLSYFKK